MEKILDKFKRYTVLFVLVMLMLILALSAVELAVITVRQILIPPVFLLDIARLQEIFGFVLIFLIGLELVESVELYLAHTSARVLAEPILLIAIIAVARKIIVLDTKAIEPFTVIGIAALMLGLTIGYFLMRKTRSFDPLDSDAGSSPNTKLDQEEDSTHDV